MIGLIDYGTSNVGSVVKAVQYLGYPAQAVDRPELLPRTAKIIFPGQGHFGAMMKALAERRLLEPLRRIMLSASAGASPASLRGGSASTDVKPFLGICLGLQVLYEGSEEAPGVAGLGVLGGCVKRFEGVFKVPHVGWSQLEATGENRILRGVPKGSFVYYCHSYYGPVTNETVAVTDYGQSFAAAVEIGTAGPLWAVQFHPEKSGQVGLRVLKNFLEL